MVVNDVIFFKKSAADYGTYKVCLAALEGCGFGVLMENHSI